MSRKTYKLLFQVLMVLLLPVSLMAQETGVTIPRQSDLFIPVSPAYQMLDAGSALVNSPAVIRDVKVDWSFKTYRLAPNIAIEVQPVWSIIYNRPTLEKYKKASGFMRTLSTLSLSAGSLDADDSLRLLSWAGKITLWRGYDPLLTEGHYTEIENEYDLQRTELESKLENAKQQFRTASTRYEKDSLDLAMFQLRTEMDQLNVVNKDRIREKQKQLNALHWNKSVIDVAFGKSYQFNRNISDKLDSVKIKERGIALWLNGSFGIGRYVMVSGLIKYDNIVISMPDSGKSKVKEIVIDEITGDTTLTDKDSLFVNFSDERKNIMSFGINVRFGNPRFSFFIEGMYTKTTTPTFTESNWENFSEYGASGKIKSSKILNEFVLAFGGEWRISNSVLLSYGIRTTVDNKVQFKNFFPLASISCLMR